MSGFSKIALFILIIIIILGGVISGISCSKIEEAITKLSPIKKEEVALTKSLIKSEDITLEKIDITPKIPKYNLPLRAEDISNYQDFSEKIRLSTQAQSLLEKNGFVVISTPKDIAESDIYLMDSRREAYAKDDFAAYYNIIKDKDLPIFITTDSLLHYYQVFFDTIIMKLQRDLFYDDIWEMSKELLDESISQYGKSNGDLREAAKRNIAYISVALELLRPKKAQIMSDEVLKEEYCTSDMSVDTCEMIIKKMKAQYGENVSFKYFSATDFKKYSFEIPDFVRSEVQKELELIEKHESWEYSPIFIYKEDYSQYVPKGHYTKSEKLKNYFKAMMWYGRMTALIKGSPDLSKGESLCTDPINGIISEYDAKIQTLQASLITKKFVESQNIQQKWQRIYSISSFFVGFSNDLGPYEYSTVLKDLFDEEITPQKIEKKYIDIKNTLLDLPYNPKIYSGLGECKLSMSCPPLSNEEIQELKVQNKKILEATKGFRLMGQRFTIDSYLLSEIVSPYPGEYTGPDLPLPTEEKPFTFTWDDNYPEFRENRPFTWIKTDVEACPPPTSRGVRGFSRGLDIMALVGSERAKEILENLGDTQYSDFEKKFSELKAEIDSISTEDWFKNLYLNWLYVLQSLLSEFGEGYQTFMQTEPWQDKELNTALASWTELKHDTILYVKHSYSFAEVGDEEMPLIVGYVEPVPEFYARLLTLTKMTDKGLKGLVSQEELEKLRICSAFDMFSEILTRLLEISKKELENKPLTDEEYRFIENFGDILDGLIKSDSGGEFIEEVEPNMFKTVLVADIHNEGNTKKVLEEGVGYIKTLVVAYKLPEGHVLLGVGPVFSYYEFKQPMENRLTDETWREMLDTTKASFKAESRVFSTYIPLVERPLWKWSIGIYTGDSPFNFDSPKNISNPVLTAKDVTDVRADFVADPFMIKENSMWYMFFEVMNAQTNQGDIGLATSKDGLNWVYQQIVLDEPFHLSYPYIFKWRNDYYIIPESTGANSIRLYKAVDFPKQWSFLGILLNGNYSDPSIFRYEGRWWIFAETNPGGNDTLSLYYADNLLGTWTEHPKSPIITGDANIARPGGRVIIFDNRIIRYTQDDDPTYGNQVRAFEITKLTTTSYKEKEVSKSHILKASGSGWNGEGMHNIDPYQIYENKWIACVDGFR